MTTPDSPPGGVDFSVMLGLQASIDTQNGLLAKQLDQQQQLNQQVYAVEIPPQTVQTTESGTLLIASAELLGPRTGECWDVRRVSISGLAGNTESVPVYRVSSPTAASAVGNNALVTMTPPASSGSIATWSPGLGGCWLRAGQSLMIYQVSLTGSEWVTLTADAIRVPASLEGMYLL